MDVRPGAVGGAGVERGRMEESRGLWEDEIGDRVNQEELYRPC